MPRRWIVLLAAGLAAAGPVAAERDVDGLEELIPHAAGPLEVQRLLERGQHPLPRGLRADPPPVAPLRGCAEWEPVTGVLIRYPLGLPYDLLRDLDDVVTLHVVVSQTYLSSARVNFAVQGVDTSAVQWLVKPNDSIWTRDYGPWFVFDGGGDLVIVDHVYNRPWRPNDDLIPVELGAQLGIPVHRHDMWHTGGNYMTDGALIAMSTDLVYDEAASANGMAPAQVDQLMLDYYGVTAYDVVPDIESGGIHHIDTWGKFLDEETVLVKEVWPGHATWAALEQRATLLASLPASTGRNYRVFRVASQDIGGGQPASYTNSLIVNDRICVPAFGAAASDSAAVAVYRAAAPGYDVRAYDHPGWLTDDALHCRAKGVMDRFMLRVEHVPVRTAQTGPVRIAARVDDRSEAGLTAVELHYRFAGGAWSTIPLENETGDDWAADIPGPPQATTVDYYVHAEDATGRAEGMPRSEPAGWYTFDIAPDPATGLAGASGTPVRAAPNPFRRSTAVSFELRFPGRVALTVVDVRGRVVRRVTDAERGPGAHRLEWDGRDDAGRPAAAGVYYLRLRAAGIVHTRPVVLAR